MDKYLGKRLDGRYELNELVGIGGMANVYKAYDITDRKEVAVKILKDEYIGNDEFLRRFRNESKAVAALSHPNIVKIFDVNFGDRIQYIIMEYVDGITLKEYIEQNTVLKWKDAVHFVVQVLRALSHAHDKGIVHRDIKPHNIMLLSDGTIKVMDFGIAQFARDEGKTGDIAIGSVHYISPEQARGDFTDEKSDIYSTGVMLYEMLTGHLPFEGDSPEKVAVMQMQAMATLPRVWNPSIPEGLEEIIVCAMQKDPKMRYATASEMLRDIDEFKRNPSILFQYKYFPTDGDTKYFSAVGKETGAIRGIDAAPEKKSWTIPILAGIAAAVVVATVLIIMFTLGPWKAPAGPDIPMENLVGLNYMEIKDQKPYRFEITDQETYTDEYEAGIIYWQDTEPGTMIKSNAKIKIKISKGIQPFEVPDTYNKTFDEAEKMLTEAGFKVEKVLRTSTDVAKGCVVLTNPARKTPAPQGATITVYVAEPNIVKAKVPNVIGQTETAARGSLDAANLKCTVIEKDSAKPKGEVIEQSHSAGAMVDEGTTITITISTGVAPKGKFTIDVDIPSGATGKWYFTVYQGGSKINSETFDKIETKGGKYSFTVTGTESNVIIGVYVSQTGKAADEKQLAQYTANFTTTTAPTRTAYDKTAFGTTSTSSSATSSKPTSSTSSTTSGGDDE